MSGKHPAYTVRARAQVYAFMQTLGLEDARKLKRAIKGLADGRGNIHALSEPLDGFYRLRQGGYRVVFWYRSGKIIECVFAERRSVIYELLQGEILARLRTGET
ncbi:cytotoxic translational repressor of toxin-antitoxin stability system [Opitutaceae bacterium TAV1]|nr:cytotoxic translational repressor of toxin-antitoxin stability system [Opitutaceae bacterium TAV5]EIQ01571.1 cytotoxic translational repressor of toxin-antitoxin stability system [Opitutaceae bacterium TAV1]